MLQGDRRDGSRPVVALAHDYVTQRGGAERVALSLTRAFPGAPLHTTLFDPGGTFPEFGEVDVRPMRINRWRILQRHHRLALPFLASTVSRSHIDADIVVASSSGWAHGIPTSGRKIVYCHAPARWLYQTERYASGGSGRRTVRGAAVRAATSVLGRSLREWDRHAAASADRYLVNSTVVQRAVKEVYGIDADVIAPPPALVGTAGEMAALDGIERPFVLCVARLLPYKNVDLVIEAVAEVPGVDLVIVGTGPDENRLRALAARVGGTRLLGRVDDAHLRWLYAHARGLVAASFEDFGLSPLEAAAFGTPTAALRDGGYLDTVDPAVNGVFFDLPDRDLVAAAVEQLIRRDWAEGAILEHAEAFSEERFITRMRQVVAEELAGG